MKEERNDWRMPHRQMGKPTAADRSPESLRRGREPPGSPEKI